MLRNTFYGMFASSYGVNMDEIVEPVDSFPRFVDFFTRKIHPRTIAEGDNVMVSPADSKILSFTEVTGNDVLLVKNIKYDLAEFITGDKRAKDGRIVQDMISKKQEGNKLYSIIFYLSPGDYHRYHSSVDFEVDYRNHIAGHLWPVKVDYVSSKSVSLSSNLRL
jgi:phosphatidylserine decarboxylase